jgi:trigger factor
VEVTKSKLPGSVLDVTVKLETGEVQSAFDKVYQEISDQGGIPGFRPGHVPPAIVRRRVDQEQLDQMVWMRLVQDNYEDILEENDIEPLDDPTFPDPDEVPLEEGQPLEFEFTVTVRPEPEIEQYKGIEAIRPEAEVTDEDIEEALQELRESEAEEITPDRDAVAEGDIANVTLSIRLEDEEEPLSESDQELEVGAGHYTPPIDEELIGRMVGQTVEIEHEYPEDFEDDELAGQTATITAKINEIREVQLPELDDEFAQAQDFEDLEDLKESVRKQVQNRLERQAREEAENSALAKILAGTTIDLPEQLVDQMAASSFEQFQSQLQSEGLDMEAFGDIAGVSEDEVRENERTRAEASLKLNFVLSEIQKREEIETDEQDLDEEIERFAQSSGSDPDFIRQALELQDGLEEQLRERALRTKIMDFILDEADIRDIPRDEWEEVKEAERERLEENDQAAGEEETAETAATDKAEEEDTEENETADADVNDEEDEQGDVDEDVEADTSDEE